MDPGDRYGHFQEPQGGMPDSFPMVISTIIVLLKISSQWLCERIHPTEFHGRCLTVILEIGFRYGGIG